MPVIFYGLRIIMNKIMNHINDISSPRAMLLFIYLFNYLIIYNLVNKEML
jgi:hypothetical protein